MKLYIKNMVCDRCIAAVRQTITARQLHLLSLQLGEAEIEETLSKAELEPLSHDLEQLGFELIDDRKSRLIEQVKNAIRKLVHQEADERTINLSTYLAQTLHHDYNTLSTLFSQVEGVTVEKYYIRQKVERVKELLVYDELSISEIAFQAGYSSVAHLSRQFKEVTGMTPSAFKGQHGHRKPLDKV
ncbi:AraC family transcriptional regulator [Chitinophaga parva]|uniref:AraC family transcriptional regulator n=1 Tax=Chitinophaga parva TaxID=2169414 RepID=A0A2T7BD81_9BACT|nr:AraC family transcriptional regulator [Chitinophaga parva]PUZ23035.1 AraC family transcriptional regulator [Chitinophaga parva]